MAPPLKILLDRKVFKPVVQTYIVTYIRKPLKGLPINYKRIKGKQYAFQVVRSWRDKETGKVMKEERYLGARKPARQKPIMSKLNVEDRERVVKAWEDGEDVDLIIARVRAYTGDPPSQATVYNFMREHGITRGERTTKRAEKRILAEEAQVERIRRLKLEDTARKARQAKRRIAARKEIERAKK